MGDVLEYARERFLDRRQQARAQRQRQLQALGIDLGAALFTDVFADFFGTRTIKQSEDWRTLNPDEDD